MNEEIRDAEQDFYRIHEFRLAFGRQIEKEFNLRFIDDFTNLRYPIIEFYAYRLATIEEARALLLSLLCRLEEAIQSDQKMLSCLDRLSLTPESINVYIKFAGRNAWSFQDGSIDGVSCSYYSTKERREYGDSKKHYIRYTANDPFSEISAVDDECITFLEEPLEEAIRLNLEKPVINPTIHTPNGFEDELSRILYNYKNEMEAAHGLHFKSIGWKRLGKSDSDLSEIRTKCTYYYPVNCQEARELMLLATERLLTILNSSETLRPYLNEIPFSASQLKLRMLFRKVEHFVGEVPFRDDSLESAVLSKNTITYYHNNSSRNPVVYAQESYQEAQKNFENAPRPTLLERVVKGIKFIIFNLKRLLCFCYVSLCVITFLFFYSFGPFSLVAFFLFIILLLIWAFRK